MDWLVATELTPDRRRHLLERLQRPDYPQLPKLVVDDLNYQNSGGFGCFGIHGQLLLAQLDECLKLKPDLLNQQNFVNVYLAKLRPNADVDWRHDPAEHRAYLERMWSFVQKLAPAHNSLKAHVLYQRLVLDRSQGVYDKPTFMAYLQLPRNANYMSPKFMELEDNRRHTADLAANFENVTLLPPVGNDEPLVRSYLQQFFVKETTYEPYTPWVNDLYLKRTFAETKIVNGLGEGEQWSAMLTPAEYQALKDRIDLDIRRDQQAAVCRRRSRQPGSVRQEREDANRQGLRDQRGQLLSPEPDGRQHGHQPRWAGGQPGKDLRVSGAAAAAREPAF